MKLLIRIAVFGSLISATSACFKPDYSEKYISLKEDEFKQYQEETKERPSPAARTKSVMRGTSVYITYSQPGVKDRTVWGDLVKYDEIWRTGANEATVLSTTGDLLVQGDTLRAGNYALYTIPRPNKWTVILNSRYNVWGAYDYDITQDVLRFDIKPYELEEQNERMLFDIDEIGTVEFKWDKLGFKFYVMPI